MLSKINRVPFSIILVVVPFLSALICIGIGRYSLTIAESLNVLVSAITGNTSLINEQSLTVILNVRLPRIIMAIAVGAGLAIAGAGLQAMFSNPLVSPDTLGVAAGASFGAAFALLLNGNLFMVQVFALFFGLVAVGIAYIVSKTRGRQSLIMLVLSGMIVSAMFQAFVSLVKYVADTDNQLPAITYWLMGSMANATYKTLAMGLPFIIIGCTIIYLLRWKINVLSLSEDEAKSMGINTRQMRLLLIVATTMVTAACVSMCGQVGWVGLLIPHVARMIFGSNNRNVIPASISLGATFLLIVDTLARSATAAEIPVSILTATIGAPFFILLLKRTGGQWS
ncbi:iron ABC transporter permease [Cytobacillus praedii]|uniref:FecCD family ABC transporter permease n=1 Tax=Cytobacillus praedii TaxID=1742358 RepID=UPI002E1C1051|nr:iron ABC transporter permease [Cytobacillus praedii]